MLKRAGYDTAVIMLKYLTQLNVYAMTVKLGMGVTSESTGMAL